MDKLKKIPKINNKHKFSDVISETPNKKPKTDHINEVFKSTSSQNKHKLNDDDKLNLEKPFKLLKIDKSPQKILTTQTSHNTSSKTTSGDIFQKSTEGIILRKIFDIGHRLNLIILPECYLNSKTCRTSQETNEKSFGMSSYDQETVRINMQADMLVEAFHVCENILRADKYFSVKTLQNIIRMILNTHQSKFKNYTVSFILQHSQRLFKLNLSAHPSCSQTVKTVYTRFLNSSTYWNDPFKHNDNDDEEFQILEYLISQLQFELSVHSPYGSILNKDKINIQGDEVSMEQGHLIKHKYEIFKNLKRKDRIKRLFIVLELVVDLLEQDFAKWLSKSAFSPRRNMVGNSKPLITIIFWHYDVYKMGSVNRKYIEIFQIFIDLIKLQFPLRKIDIISRLLNLISNAVYCCDENPNYIYSNIGNFSKTFATELFNILKCEDIKMILQVINKLKAKYLQYLLSSMTLKTILNSKENFEKLAIRIFKEDKWSQFPKHVFTSPPKKPIQESVSNCDDDLLYIIHSTKLKNKSKSKFKYLDSKNKNHIELSKQNIDRLMFTLTFYYSLKYFVEFHDVESIQILTKKNMNKPYSDFYEKHEKSVITADSVFFVLNEDNENQLNINKILKTNNSVTEEGIRFYRNIFESVLAITSASRNIRHARPEVYSVFRYINSIRLF